MFWYIILWISFFSALKGIVKAHIMGIVSKKKGHILWAALELVVQMSNHITEFIMHIISIQ